MRKEVVRKEVARKEVVRKESARKEAGASQTTSKKEIVAPAVVLMTSNQAPVKPVAVVEKEKEIEKEMECWICGVCEQENGLTAKVCELCLMEREE